MMIACVMLYNNQRSTV